MLLWAPRHVHRDSEGRETEVGDPFANQIYLSQEAISRIVLHESYGIDEHDYETHREWVRGKLLAVVPPWVAGLLGALRQWTRRRRYRHDSE